MATEPKRPFLLVICDGWGEAEANAGNAITAANTPRFDALQAQWPHTTVEASGEAVGLPAGQQGNSEVGHLTIGTGRIIMQPLSRQLHEIASGAFYQNEILLEAIEIAKQRATSLHIIGLVSPGGVHSHSNGALALVKLAKEHELDRVHIHAFTDGRDTPPTSALDHLKEFEEELEAIGTGRIASVAGRYYAMDRDNRWERVELAYDMLTGNTNDTWRDAKDYVSKKYEAGETDEFLKPVSIANTPEDRTHIEDGDVVVFFNFRPDRARQLSHALVDKEFSGFERKRVLTDLHFVSFSEYDSELAAKVAFPKQNVGNSLAEVVSKAGLKQYHVAETEKYAHVTYFLNGGQEVEFEGEDRQLIPSPQVATYDVQPEMSARQVADDVMQTIREETHDLIVVNLANADMVGHTGDFEATKQAVEVLDECIGDMVETVLLHGGAALMTADHGNAEIEINEEGKPVTSHTTSNVPVLLCGTDATRLRSDGGLSDVAPTVLDVMNLPAPQEMTGNSLISR